MVDNLVEDTETMCFGDLEHYSVAFEYDKSNSLVYFQCDGHTFEKNVRVLYDDASIKEMIEIFKPFDAIHLFVDHFDFEDLETQDVDRLAIQINDREGSEGSDEDDPDFSGKGSDSQSDDLEFLNDGRDDELITNVKNMKIRKVVEANKVNVELRRNMIKNRDEKSECDIPERYSIVKLLNF